MTHQLMALCRPILAGVGFLVGVSACTDLLTAINESTGPDDHPFSDVISAAEDFTVMGQVESVNLLESSFVTSEGIVVRVSDETELWQVEGDHLK